jgi:3-phosphoshikimate 1-carboxyvinyltransferase
MRELGASIIHKKNSLEVKKSSYQFPQTFQIEKDWSAAAYWFLYVSMHPKSSILLETLNENNLQGDTMQLQWYAQLNVESTQTKEGILLKHKMQSSSLNEHTYNMKDNPDLFPSLVINLAFLQQKAIFYNISHIRIKESDRIQAIAEILDSLGAECRVDEDTFYLEKGIDLSRKDQVFTFSSHKDHRIAMTLGILRTYFINIQIDDEECVIKSYPNFWQDLAKVQFTL